MNEATGLFEARLQALEHRHSALLASHTNLRDRYESLLKVTKDLAGHAADASVRASVSAEQARLAGNRAVAAARYAAAHGERQMADDAFAAAKAAADAAAHATQAAAMAWKAVLVAAGHGAERELLSQSWRSWEASKAAFADASEVMTNVTRAAWEL